MNQTMYIINNKFLTIEISTLGHKLTKKTVSKVCIVSTEVWTCKTENANKKQEKVIINFN